MKCLLSIDRCLIVQIGNVLFCNVYLPPVGSVRHIEIISGVLNTISNVIQECVCKYVVVGGDFNRSYCS